MLSFRKKHLNSFHRRKDSKEPHVIVIRCIRKQLYCCIIIMTESFEWYVNKIMSALLKWSLLQEKYKMKLR